MGIPKTSGLKFEELDVNVLILDDLGDPHLRNPPYGSSIFVRGGLNGNGLQLWKSDGHTH